MNDLDGSDKFRTSKLGSWELDLKYYGDNNEIFIFKALMELEISLKRREKLFSQAALFPIRQTELRKCLKLMFHWSFYLNADHIAPERSHRQLLSLSVRSSPFFFCSWEGDFSGFFMSENYFKKIFLLFPKKHSLNTPLRKYQNTPSVDLQ